MINTNYIPEVHNARLASQLVRSTKAGTSSEYFRLDNFPTVNLLIKSSWCIGIILLGRVALVAQRPKLNSRGRSVGLSVGLTSALWKNGSDAVWIRIVCRTGAGMRQVFCLGIGPRAGVRTVGGEFGARHCNQWGLYGVRMQQRRNAALFLNYFNQSINHLFA